MARNSKKKDLPPEAGQDSQSIEIAGMDLTAESMSMPEFADEMAESFPDQSNNPSVNGEVTMNANTESVEAQEPVESVDPVINLESNLSIQNAVKLYDKLKKAYAIYDSLEIDASHVNSVDTASLQVFVALKKDAMKNNKQVDFFQPSARFVESARLLDLLDVLEIIDV
jgi:anti-anti-sigma regulatory factor